MVVSTSKIKKLAAASTLGALLAIGVAVPSLADNIVGASVTGGSRTATLSDIAFDPVSYSHEAQDLPAESGVLTVDDLTGSGAGWNVTISSSALAYTGGATDGVDIANTALTLASLSAPVVVPASGSQAVDVDEGPMVPDPSPVGTDLSASRKVLQANAGFGVGNYTQDVGLDLIIPAQARAGTYSATLTVTAQAGP